MIQGPALFVYHCLSNSRDLHQTLDDGEAEPERVEPQLEVPLDCGPALHTLLSGEILPLDEKDMAGDPLRVIDLAQALLDAGIATRELTVSSRTGSCLPYVGR